MSTPSLRPLGDNRRVQPSLVRVKGANQGQAPLFATEIMSAHSNRGRHFPGKVPTRRLPSGVGQKDKTSLGCLPNSSHGIEFSNTRRPLTVRSTYPFSRSGSRHAHLTHARQRFRGPLRRRMHSIFMSGVSLDASFSRSRDVMPPLDQKQWRATMMLSKPSRLYGDGSRPRSCSC